MENSFWWQIIPHLFDVKYRFHHQQMESANLTCHELVEVSIDSWHVKFADSDIVVYEYVGFGFDVGSAITIVGHCFVWWVATRSTVQTLDDFSYICAVWIQHCALKEIFPAICLGLVESLSGFTTSLDPLLSLFVDSRTEAISSTEFGWHMWSHPRFGFLAGFWFLNVDCCSKDKNIVETRYTKR